jgi:hypothetical protein
MTRKGVQTSALSPADYIARVRLSDREDRTLAAPGEVCVRVPAASLAWLLEEGLIVRADAPEDADGQA